MRTPILLAALAATGFVAGCGDKTAADMPPTRSVEGAAVQRNVQKINDLEKQAKEKASDANATTAPAAP